MRPCSFFALSIALCAVASAVAQTPATPTCADLHVVPALRDCTAVASIPVKNGIRIVLGRNAEDQFTASDLADTLKSRGVSVSEREGALVRLERADESLGRTLLERNHLKFDAAMHDEGYVLVPDGTHGLAVVAETAKGMFYGAQTVKQLVRGEGKDAELLMPTARDWPAMAYRGLSDDWSRGPLPNMEFLKREIRILAAYKYNIFSPYFEATYAYASMPVPAFPGGAMTPGEAREMVAYAAKYHITVIPEQESFGHLHHVLKFEQFSPMGETPHGAVLAPGDARTLPLINEWFGELAKVFPGPWFHIGADETFELGLGRTRAEVKEKGMSPVYLDFLSRIHSELAPYHKRLLFWGDIAIKSPELVGTLPKDMIAVPWRYDAEPDFTALIEPFTKAGLETWVAPGVNNWNRVYPNNNEALGNIRAFVRDGQKLGAKGMLNTVWNDDGEGIFDQNWYGVLFGAAAGWQPGESSEAAFEASYGLAFQGDQTGKIDQAQLELMAAHAALKQVGLTDVEDRYFWLDPFSAAGQKVSAKLLPVAAQMRLHAEKAIALLAEARAAGKLRHPDALDAMELGARRMDFVGLKFQEAAECASIYADAQAISGDQSRWDEVSELLYSISSINGKMQDMRDGYTQLGQLYKQAWLRDNRPFWLENNMARYDRAAQLWIGRSDDWQQVVERWWNTHTLEPASEVGLPEASTAGK
ncbi:MAG TPA: family 20 glycosylhydrolase [Terracidiphilus sp.]|nr:family 20 glycosylhydrolase [Terracidiphilus sp.]